MAKAMVVNSGLDIITNRLKGTGTEPVYVHWGTGIIDPVATDTTLGTPRAEARVQGVSARVTQTATNDTYQVVGTIVCASTAAAITEVALFDAITSGNMFLRATFAPLNLNVGDAIEFTIKTVFKDGN